MQGLSPRPLKLCYLDWLMESTKKIDSIEKGGNAERSVLTKTLFFIEEKNTEKFQKILVIKFQFRFRISKDTS